LHKAIKTTLDNIYIPSKPAVMQSGLQRLTTICVFVYIVEVFLKIV